MPSYFPENNQSQWGDPAERSLQKIATLLYESRIPVDIGGSSVNINGPVTVTNEVEVTNDVNSALPVAGYDPIADQPFPLEITPQKRLRVLDEKVLESLGDLSGTGSEVATTDTQAGRGAVAFLKRLCSQATGLSSRLPTLVSGRIPVTTIFDSPQPVTGPLTDAELRATAVGVTGPLTDTQLRATAVGVTGPLTDTQLRATAVGITFSGPQPVTGPLTDVELRATAVPVSGPLTDTQLRATAVPVSGPLTDTQLRATAVPVSGPLTDAELRATAVSIAATQLPTTLGPKTPNSCLAVVLPTDQAAVETRAFSASLTALSGTASLTSTEVLAASTTRRYFLLQNLSDDPIHLNFDGIASIETLRVEASAIMVFEGSFVPQNAINMIGTVANQKYFIAYHNQ